MYMYNEIISCLVDVGIQIDTTKDDIDLTEYNLDSFVFMGFIVSVENKFNIVVPDEYLVYDNFRSLKGFTQLVADLMH